MRLRLRLLLLGTGLAMATACSDGGITLPHDAAEEGVSAGEDVAELEDGPRELEDGPSTDRNPGSSLSGGSPSLETVFSDGFDPADEQTSGDGWELLAIRESTTSRQAVEIGVGEQRWTEVWDRFGFASDPPAVDHEQVVPLIATFDSDCPVILHDVRFADEASGPVRIVAQTPDTCEQFVEASRTVAIAVDRERLVIDRFRIDAGTSQSIGAVDLTETEQPPPPFGQEPDLPLDAVSIRAGEPLTLELGTTADADVVVNQASPDDELSIGVSALWWDGVQWIPVDESPDVAIEERPGDEERWGRLELDTGGLQPGAYWLEFGLSPPTPVGLRVTAMIRVLE